MSYWLCHAWPFDRTKDAGLDVSEERGTSIIRMRKIGELGMVAVTSNRCML
jgi:hypothetical protein